MKSIQTPFIQITILLLICQVQLVSQNVGIGTNNPSAKLHLQSTIQTNTSLDLNFETGAIDPANTSGDYDWYITGTDGYNSAKSAKAPFMFNADEKALLAYGFDMSLGKEITVSFDYKYDDPTGLVDFSISGDGFTFDPPSAPVWKFYSTTFISQSTSNTLKIVVKALQDEAFPIVHMDNIMITYPDGHVLKIEDGTEADGHFLQSDALGHTEWYDLRAEIDQKINDKSLDLEFDTNQNALGIENGNFVLIPALKNDFGKSLQLLQSEILVSPGMSLHLPSSSSDFPTLHFDAANKTMDWGHNPDSNKGEFSTRWGNNSTASNTYSTAWGNSNNATGVNSTSWGLNSLSAGLNSTSWGKDNWAHGENSTSFGSINSSPAESSTSWGNNTIASGIQSTTWGYWARASGLNSTVWGNTNEATEENSTSWGLNNLSSGINSTTWGEGNIASGSRSTAFGNSNEATGSLSTIWGSGNTASVSYASAWGQNNNATSNRSTAWGNSNVASGANSTSFGKNNVSSAINTTTYGEDNTAAGVNSSSFGDSNTSNGEASNSWGYNNSVESLRGTAWGGANIVSSTAENGTVCGSQNSAIGENSFVTGYNNSANSFAEVAIGYFNYSAPGTADTWQNADMLFTIGNGLTPTYPSNALVVLKNGNIGIGNNSPSYDLHLQGNSAAKPGSSTWTVSSDRRLKKDISAFTDGLEIISAIEPVWFTYNGLADIPESTYVGTIAQELEEIAPYMVSEYTYRDDDGNSENYKAVDYGAMDFVLINAIKEQQAIIEAQEKKIVSQQSQIDDILKMMTKLNSKVME